MIPQSAASGSVRSWAALTMAAAILLGGCSLTPPYQRPAYQLPRTLGELYPQQAAKQQDSAESLSAQEARFLRQLSPNRDLSPLVIQALAHNADFRLTTLQVAQAHAQYGIEQSQRWPQLGFDVQDNRQQFHDPALQARYGEHVAVASVGITDFDFDFFGRLAALSDAAREHYLASSYGQQAARGALIAEALRAYALERSAAEALAQWQAVDIDSAELLRIAVHQQQVGLISDDALNDQHHQADQAHANALQVSADHNAAIRALQLVAGYTATPAEGSLEELLASDGSQDQWRSSDSKVLLQRPDIQQAEAELRAANADIGAARAAFFPSISLSTSLGTASNSLRGLFDAGTQLWTFVPQLTLPIFDGGRNQANLSLAKLRKQACIVDYEKAIQSAFREVADALDAHTPLLEREQRETAQAEREQERTRRMTARTAEGWEDRSALLVERIQAARAQLDAIQAGQNLVLNRIALFQAFYGVQPTSSI